MVRRLADVRGYLAQPLLLTRGQVLVTLAALGLGVGLATVLSVAGIRGISDERAARAAAARAQLRRELHAERRAREAGDVAGRRLAALEHPTTRRLEVIVRRELVLLRRRPELAATLGATLAAATTMAPSPSPPRPTSPPRSSSSAPPRPRPPSTSRPPSSSAPPASRPSPPARPPVDVPNTVTTPVGTITLPSACVPRVGGVGCP